MDVNYKSLNQIISLIKAYLNEELNDDQKEHFEEWLAESEENQRLLERIKRSNALSKRVSFREQIVMEDEWSKLKSSINHNYRIDWFKSFLKYASIIVVIIGVASLFIIEDYQKNKSLQTVRIEPKTETESVVLTLASGEKVKLGNKNKKDIIIEDGVSVKDSVDQLTYYPVPKKKSIELRYNTISIPRGGEYKLKLADGTEIYLNSESLLKFPEHFADDIRQIELTGEAYLKVSKDKNRPFIVKMNNTQVEVLGTEFNLRSYSDESFSSATLVEGSIKVSLKDKAIIIKPGQQAYIDREEKMHVNEVNTQRVTSWVRGEFVFENERLEDVLRTMARWYDVEFDYSDANMKEYRFTGKLKRYTNIKQALLSIEKTNVIKFNIRGRQIEVKDFK